MHNAQSRQWIHPKCGTLFADASDEPWKLWSFVLQSSDAASAFACFIASVVFHTIPKRTSKTTSQFGGTSFSREDMDEYVNTAEYILTNQ
ncbi:hypothetical protein GPJ56_003813 [Histomonas meleagridis]|uniref:uncharacterized protein n=1 Tax=Histomonas meleagridis TaxID=135588 RepID=UPI0035598783|nr:hypothetical protein GPJ56_003813 [Histomonas meleagridis]KAH0805271.1 hypothetical protein GO595_002216 [Histomonas meleagridis]